MSVYIVTVSNMIQFATWHCYVNWPIVKSALQENNSKAYRMLGLLHCCFSQFQSVFAKRTLYLSLVKSQAMCCSIVWRPNLIKDITLVERIQRRATKFILNDYNSSYFDRLKKLNLLFLKYIFELNKVLFTLLFLQYNRPYHLQQ